VLVVFPWSEPLLRIENLRQGCPSVIELKNESMGDMRFQSVETGIFFTCMSRVLKRLSIESQQNVRHCLRRKVT